MRIIHAKVDLREMLVAALLATLAAPLGVLGWIVCGIATGPAHGGALGAMLVFALIAWLISAATTFFIGLPFALLLRYFGALGWLPVCAFGTALGELMLSGIGAIFGLATSTMFCVGCRPSHDVLRKASTQSQNPV